MSACLLCGNITINLSNYQVTEIFVHVNNVNVSSYQWYQSVLLVSIISDMCDSDDQL